MGGGGPGGGMSPPLQKPDLSAMADYHGPEGADPRDQRGTLPPVKKKRARPQKQPDIGGAVLNFQKGRLPLISPLRSLDSP